MQRACADEREHFTAAVENADAALALATRRATSAALKEFHESIVADLQHAEERELEELVRRAAPCVSVQTAAAASSDVARHRARAHAGGGSC